METQSSSTTNSQQQLIGVGILLKQTWQIFTSHLVLFIGVIAPVLAIIVFLDYFAYSDWNVLVALPITMWADLSLLYAIKERDQGISIVQALQRGARGLIFFIWIGLLSWFITMGGLMLFIIPGVILLVQFIFAGYVFVDEGMKGMNALLRSKQLVTGYGRKVFLRFLAIGLLWLVAYMPILVFLDILDVGRPIFTLDPEITKQSFFVGDAVTGILGLVFTIFYSIFGFLLYENLKRIKGNLVFKDPSRGTKIKYLAIGFGGLLVPIIVVLLAVVSALIVDSIR